MGSAAQAMGLVYVVVNWVQKRRFRLLQRLKAVESPPGADEHLQAR
jgi:hypothetical protein